MNVVITETSLNGLPYKAQSNDGRYQWFTGQESYLMDTVVDRAIYQMSYMRKTEFGSDPLPADVKADALEFWRQLHAIQRTAEDAARKKEVDAIIAEARRPRTEAEKAFDRAMADNDLIDAEDAWINNGRKGPPPRWQKAQPKG